MQRALSLPASSIQAAFNLSNFEIIFGNLPGQN